MSNPDHHSGNLWLSVLLLVIFGWVVVSFIDVVVSSHTFEVALFPPANEPVFFLRIALILLMIGEAMMLSAQQKYRVQMEQSRLALPWLYQTLDHLPTAVAVVDMAMRYLYVNPHWMHILQLDEQTIIGHHHFDMFPHLGDDWKTMCRRCLDDDTPLTLNAPFTYPDGTVKWLQWDIRTWYSEENTIGGLILSVAETIDQQQDDRPPSMDETYYRTVMDYATDAIFIAENDGLYIDVNSRACEMLGYTQDELLRMTISDLVAPETMTQQPLRTPELQEGKFLLSERLLVRKDGSRIPVEISARQLPDGRLMGIVRDITERKQAEVDRLEKERLLAALEQQQELSALKTYFMTRVSHEFRTPLAIIGVSSFLLNKHFESMSNEKRTEHLDKINTYVDELGRMMDDVLMVLRAEDQSLSFNPERVDVGVVCRDILETLRITYHTNRPITFTHGDNLKDVAIDQYLLQHILTNLLTNALKFSPEGQPVQLDVRLEGQHVVFTVSDEGIGIPENSLTKIFDAYYRAPNVEDISGAGLGLRIVRDCTNRHNGQIHVDSTLDKGSTFTVTLPIASVM